MTQGGAPEFSSETQHAIEAVRVAASEIMDVYNTDFSSEIRDGEPVTQADNRSNKKICHELSKTSHPILSEESPDDRRRITERKIWIVDPLDGTSDFVNKTGQFSIMIGFVDQHISVMGLVYQPLVDILYIAEKGRGAFRKNDNEWSQISVSSARSLPEANVIMSRHHLSDRDMQLLKKLKKDNFLKHGSCGLKIAAIAEGRADLYFALTDKIKQWDTCAAACIITEAGGSITDMEGKALMYNTDQLNHANGILVSNGHLSNEVISMYKQDYAVRNKGK